MFFRSRRKAPVVVDPDEQAAVIAQWTGAPVEQVSAVLELVFEQLVLVGIAQAPGHAFRFYPPEERAAVAASGAFDETRVIRDALRLAGVPEAVALDVLEAEVEYLAERGLTGR